MLFAFSAYRSRMRSLNLLLQSTGGWEAGSKTTESIIRYLMISARKVPKESSLEKMAIPVGDGEYGRREIALRKPVMRIVSRTVRYYQRQRASDTVPGVPPPCYSL